MRISADENDPGYQEWLAMGGSSGVGRITLDGEDIQNASMADDELGVVRLPALGRDGQLVACKCPDCGSEFIPEYEAKGVVTIEPAASE